MQHIRSTFLDVRQPGWNSTNVLCICAACAASGCVRLAVHALWSQPANAQWSWHIPCVSLHVCCTVCDNTLSGIVLSETRSLRANSCSTWGVNHMVAWLYLSLIPLLRSNSSPFLKWQRPNKDDNKKIYVHLFIYVYSPFTGYIYHMV